MHTKSRVADERCRHRMRVSRPGRPAPIPTGLPASISRTPQAERHNPRPQRPGARLRLGLVPVLLLASGAALLPRHASAAGERSLAPCPPAPHCVSSEASDAKHRVAPLHLSGSQATVRARIVHAVESMPRTRIVVAKGDYVHATYTSRVFGFVDDVEFVIHAGGRVDVRSSSRTGYYDFGVNRNRVATLRKKLQRPPGAD